MISTTLREIECSLSTAIGVQQQACDTPIHFLLQSLFHVALLGDRQRPCCAWSICQPPPLPVLDLLIATSTTNAPEVKPVPTLLLHFSVTLSSLSSARSPTLAYRLRQEATHHRSKTRQLSCPAQPTIQDFPPQTEPSLEDNHLHSNRAHQQHTHHQL